jgi:HlyD family secretion protein
MDLQHLHQSLRRHLLIGVGSIALLCGTFGAWASVSQLSGAVIAPGRLAIEGKAKSVQHLTGGVVADLLAKEGDRVEAGQVVVRLDGTVAGANLSAISANLNQLYAREARLTAERDDLTEVRLPDILSKRLGHLAQGAMVSERRLFDDRRVARQGQKDQLQEEIGQVREQIAGLEVQRQSKDDEISLIEKEMVGTRQLYDLGLTPLNRINNLDRSVARLRGERGALVAQSATAKARISEIQLKRIDVDQKMRAEVASELRDVHNRQAELIEREVAAKDQLKRLDIVSPVAGTVHDLAIHTVGGVVKPGNELMQVVPRVELTVEARIQPQDIDQLSIAQLATVRMTAFNRNTTPELSGKVVRISADLETDQRTGVGFYRAAVAIAQAEQDKLGDLTLMPGMPAEVFIRTTERTVLSYLLKPIRDHAERVFRDE